jgi:hypothetical protein
MTTDSGLLHLLTDWANGGEILAGTGVPAQPAGPRMTVWKACPRRGCGTILGGADEDDLSRRLKGHADSCC